VFPPKHNPKEVPKVWNSLYNSQGTIAALEHPIVTNDVADLHDEEYQRNMEMVAAKSGLEAPSLLPQCDEANRICVMCKITKSSISIEVCLCLGNLYNLSCIVYKILLSEYTSYWHSICLCKVVAMINFVTCMYKV
jgi:hypothetical protein